MDWRYSAWETQQLDRAATRLKMARVSTRGRERKSKRRCGCLTRRSADCRGGAERRKGEARRTPWRLRWAHGDDLEQDSERGRGIHGEVRPPRHTGSVPGQQDLEPIFQTRLLRPHFPPNQKRLARSLKTRVPRSHSEKFWE